MQVIATMQAKATSNTAKRAWRVLENPVAQTFRVEVEAEAGLWTTTLEGFATLAGALRFASEQVQAHLEGNPTF